MRVLKLIVENFMRIKMVCLTPNGEAVEITGRNRQGKTTALKAFMALIGGEAECPEEPIRKGEKGARVLAELGEPGEPDVLVVTKTWGYRADGSVKVELVVAAKDGATYKSPQTMLNAFYGKLSFNPVAFLTSKTQAETLRKITGLDTKALDDERATVFAQRTLVGRDGATLRGVADGIWVPGVPAAPETTEVEADVSVTALAQELARRRGELAEIQRKTREALRAVDAYTRFKEATARARVAYDAAVEEEASAQLLAAELTAGPDPVEPDIAEAEAELSGAEAKNDLLRAERARQAEAVASWRRACEDRAASLERKAEAQARVEAKRAEYAAMTVRIEAIDTEKLALVAAAEMPIPGLGLNGDMVTFNGLPFTQAAHSEQIRVSVAISAALNPRLKVALIDEASSLDEESRTALFSECAARGVQPILTCVAHGQPVGIVIEDGEVVS